MATRPLGELGALGNAPARTTRAAGHGCRLVAASKVCSPNPTAIASGIPPKKPLGVLSQVLKSP